MCEVVEQGEKTDAMKKVTQRRIKSSSRPDGIFPQRMGVAAGRGSKPGMDPLDPSKQHMLDRCAE